MTQLEKKLKIPFTTRLTKVCNYAQAVTELKLMQKRHQGASQAQGTDFLREDTKIREEVKALGNIFVRTEENVSVKDVIDGFLHRKIRKMQEAFESKVMKEFSQHVDTIIGDIKESQHFKSFLAHSTHPKDIEALEAGFDRDAEPACFSKPIVADLYFFLRDPATSTFSHERRFLERQFLNYIKRFYKENMDRVLIKPKSVEDKVREFVKLRYNKSDYNIEVFEGRYLYAEAYVLLRCGMLDQVKAMVRKVAFFPAQFTDKLVSYIDDPQRVSLSPILKSSDDKFKQIIYQLISSPESIQPGPVVSTLEDYLWVKILATQRGHSVKFDDMVRESKSPTNKLFIAVMGKKYTLAQETLLKEDFSVTDAFYLCTELYRKEGVRNPLFVNFVFLVAKRFASAEKRAKVIQTLHYLTQAEVGRKIVEYEMYDVVELLPKEYGRELVAILHGSNNKKMLLKLYFINDDDQEIACLLEETLSEEIASERTIASFDEFEHSGIYSYLSDKYGIDKYPRLKVLRDFLEFKIRRDIPSLQQTVLFDEAEIDVLRGLGCIDTVAIIASDVVAAAKSSFLAQKLLNVTGRLALGEYSQRVLLKKLIDVL